MFKTLKRWLGFKDKEESTMATKHPDGINVNPPAPPNIRPETPPPAPPIRTHHVTRSAPDPYYNTVLNNPILFVDALPRSYSSGRDCDSYKSSGSSSCDSGSSSSDSRSSSSD